MKNVVIKGNRLVTCPAGGGECAIAADDLTVKRFGPSSAGNKNLLKKYTGYTYYLGGCKVTKKAGLSWLFLTAYDCRESVQPYAIINADHKCIILLRSNEAPTIEDQKKGYKLPITSNCYL